MKKIEEISVIEHQKYNISNIIKERIGPINYYCTYEEAEAAARMVDTYNSNARKPQNVKYEYEITKLKRTRLYKATTVIK